MYSSNLAIFYRFFKPVVNIFIYFYFYFNQHANDSIRRWIRRQSGGDPSLPLPHYPPAVPVPVL
jgi:hypothetical protein